MRGEGVEGKGCGETPGERTMSLDEKMCPRGVFTVPFGGGRIFFPPFLILLAYSVLAEIYINRCQ